VLCLRDDTSNITLDYLFSTDLCLTVAQLTPNGQLRHGQNMSFVLRITAPPSDREISGYLTIRAVGDNGSAQWVAIPITVKASGRPGATVSVEGLGLALAIFLALGGIALGWNEVVLLALLTLLLPLYSKIRREEVLDQYTRGKLHGYIIANPGEHYNSLKAQLRMKNGTLAYHLRVLEREGFVKSARDGPFKRFYPQEMAVPKRRSEFSSIQEIVLENIRASPGVTQNDLARRMGVSSQVVNYHVRGLVTAGRVRLERLGRTTKCYIK
jgi:predicted transcriptional regulator